MMIGEQRNHSNPTVHVPPWPFSSDDPTATDHYYNNLNSPVDDITLLSLQRFLPSNTLNNDPEDGFDFPVDNFSSDQFRIYEFKVRKCTHGRSHDWTECPFAHPGEKARRRDPRKFHYSGTACPEYRKGGCRKGDSCEFAHGVFECWLHPGRYRTQPCKDGLNCRRRVCFFAHAPDQLRVLSPRGGNTNHGSNTEVFETGGLYSPHRLGGNTNHGSNTEVFETGMYSPHRLAFEGNKNFNFVSSPESNSPPTESPPMSPISPMRVNQVQSLSRSLGSGSGHGFGSGSGSISEMVASLRQLQLNKINSSWGLEPGFSPPGLGSGRVQMIRPEFCSLPNTPTRVMTRPGIGYFDAFEEEPVMERVESGRGLRARMFEKLSKENSLDSSGSGQDPNLYEAPNPDVGWVTDLLQ